MKLPGSSGLSNSTAAIMASSTGFTFSLIYLLIN